MKILLRGSKILLREDYLCLLQTVYSKSRGLQGRNPLEFWNGIILESGYNTISKATRKK